MNPGQIQLDQLHRIICIRLGALGDVVRTIPAVQALRAAAPGARIAWLVDDRCTAVLKDLPYVDELIIVPRRELRAASRSPRKWSRWCRTLWALRRRLRAWKANAVFDFHGLFKTSVLTRWTAAPIRVGYVRGHSKEGSWRAYNVLVNPGPVRIPRIERNLALVEHCGAHRLSVAPEVPFDESERATIEDFLSGYDRSRLVALYPGTSLAGHLKRWPTSRFGMLADMLVERLDLLPLIVWGPGEEDLVEEIRAHARHKVLVAPATSQKELALLLGGVRCYVGGDTSATHFASIMGTPVVVLLGPSDPIHNQPMPYCPWRMVEPDTEKPFDQRRMSQIEPERVFDAVAQLLAEVNGS